VLGGRAGWVAIAGLAGAGATGAVPALL